MLAVWGNIGGEIYYLNIDQPGLNLLSHITDAAWPELFQIPCPYNISFWISDVRSWTSNANFASFTTDAAQPVLILSIFCFYFRFLASGIIHVFKQITYQRTNTGIETGAYLQETEWNGVKIAFTEKIICRRLDWSWTLCLFTTLWMNQIDGGDTCGRL